MTDTAVKTKTFPVLEVFGPTIQGEGALAGLPTLFVRFGGCDYRCSWCDTKYAVEPELVRANAEWLSAEEIVQRCGALAPEYQPIWVTLSGGNPALMDFDRAPLQYAFVAGMHRRGFKVAVETQGSLWRDWLAEVDMLTVSPKPPSSGEASMSRQAKMASFLARAERTMPPERRCLKIVVFDDDDYDWARDVIRDWRGGGQQHWPSFLSAGTPPIEQWGSDVREAVNIAHVRRQVCERYDWLCSKVAADPAMRETRVLPQLHVLAWGHSRGV